jgi:glyoxylase-like metal-dependent hydrolase (beta-lactamase superfamily II)
MRIHHLSCGTFCPLGGRLLNEHGGGLFARLVCHCLLIETASSGLVLIDTGLGLNDVARPYPRLNRALCALTGLRLRAAETAAAQIDALGFARADVRHVVLTHLDFDHAGGLDDFPSAQVHVMASELAAARARPSPLSRGRYRPAQFAHAHWNEYAPAGEPWNGFSAARQLKGLPPEILLIPLAGHTLGHAGVAIDTGAGGSLLHAGDAYFHHAELSPAGYRCPPGLRIYQWLMEADRAQRLANLQRLRTLSREAPPGLRIFSAHDPAELAVLAAARGSQDL